MTLSRPLTLQEQTLAPPALAAAFDLDAVRILRRWHTPIAAALNMTVVRGVRIFWANAPQEALTLAERAHLAHELVHVWQYRALKRTGPELLASRIYRYALDPARAFLAYGYEQQAAIVEDFVRLRDGAPARWAVAPARPLADYERVIATAAL
ncbi:MAG: hypothetical protein AB7F91_02185 [Parvularculaceae bacterium]